MLEAGAVEPSKLPCHLQIGVDEDRETKPVPLDLGTNCFGGSVCHGHDLHAVTLRKSTQSEERISVPAEVWARISGNWSPTPMPFGDR